MSLFLFLDFSNVIFSPMTWANCTARVNAFELPSDAIINTNGAGDAFTSGLLIAAMLRRTGVSPVNRNSKSYEDSSDDDVVPAFPTSTVENIADNNKDSSKKKKTPYTLYIRDQYLTLKEANTTLDKKAIFLKCHELWENESLEIKAMYERKCKEELEEATESTDSLLELVDIPHHPDDEDMPKPVFHAFDSASLNLDTAAQLASLIASYHVDVSTRDLEYLDLSMLLDRAMIFPHGLEEI